MGLLNIPVLHTWCCYPLAIHVAQVTVRDTELQQEVRVVNSGEQDLSFTAALHSYFRVGDIGQVCRILHPADALCERLDDPCR